MENFMTIEGRSTNPREVTHKHAETKSTTVEQMHQGIGKHNMDRTTSTQQPPQQLTERAR